MDEKVRLMQDLTARHANQDSPSLLKSCRFGVVGIGGWWLVKILEGLG